MYNKAKGNLVIRFGFYRIQIQRRYGSPLDLYILGGEKGKNDFDRYFVYLFFFFFFH